MTKVLNLDSLTEEKRTITLNGVTHEVIGMSVEAFIKMQKISEALGETESIGEKMKATVDMIVATVPTLDAQVLMAMPLEKVSMIASFINGVEPETEPEAEGDEAKKE